jgi:hypothetical protein
LWIRIEVFCRLPYKRLIFRDFFYIYLAFLLKTLIKALFFENISVYTKSMRNNVFLLPITWFYDFFLRKKSLQKFIWPKQENTCLIILNDKPNCQVSRVLINPIPIFSVTQTIKINNFSLPVKIFCWKIIPHLLHFVCVCPTLPTLRLRIFSKHLMNASKFAEISASAILRFYFFILILFLFSVLFFFLLSI